jgi:hypothetical protein
MVATIAARWGVALVLRLAAASLLALPLAFACAGETAGPVPPTMDPAALAAGQLLIPSGAAPARADAPVADAVAGPRLALRTTCPRTATRTLLTVDPTGLVHLFKAPDDDWAAPGKPDRWKRISQGELARIAEAIRAAQTPANQDQPPRQGARPTPDVCGHTLFASVDGASSEIRYGLLSKAAPPVQALVRTLEGILDDHPWKTGPVAEREATLREVPGFVLRRTFRCTRPLHSGVEDVDAFGVARLFSIAGRGATTGGKSTNAVKKLPEADFEELLAFLRRSKFASIPAAQRTPDPHRSRVYDACSHTLEIMLDGKHASFTYDILDRTTPPVQALIRGIWEILDRWEYREGFF